ncbi:hypothetical protein BJY04DRAFT_232332 [Aspergillus karnatakaensis]|uniref:uncharacterized protein n=1 Tax=Aspergillus karnatakaensis TaxID=1810916 RepID=UPI003CCD5C8C
MSWIQVSPIRWERPSTGVERYLYFTGNGAMTVYGRRQYTLVSTLKVELNLPHPQATLRQAWLQLRHQEPDLAATLEEGGEKKVYETPDQRELGQWLQRTFVVLSSNNAEEVLNAGPDGYAHGYAMDQEQATLYYLPKSSELILHAHHWLIDGIGMLIFWDKFLTALTSPRTDLVFGTEYTRLNPTVHEALGHTSLSQSNIEQATELLSEYIINLPALGPVSNAGKVASGVCRSFEHRWSVSSTSAIIRACKKRGISVTAAVHAAYILVLKKYADPESTQSRYTNVPVFNLRPFCLPPFNTVAMGCYYTTMPLTVGLSASTSFAKLAETLSQYYSTCIKCNPERLESNAAFANLMAQLACSPEYLSAPVPSDAFFSSLGIVESHLKRVYGGTPRGAATVRVEDYRLWVDIVVGMNMAHVYTFGDQLRVAYHFNEGYEEGEMIKRYLEEMEGVLERELIR